MLWSIEEIQSGRSITVRYTGDSSYFDGPCRCASCHPDHPPNIIRQPAGGQEAACGVEEPLPGGKRKRHRAGKRMRRIRQRQLEESEREMEMEESEQRRREELKREIEGLERDVKGFERELEKLNEKSEESEG